MRSPRPSRCCTAGASASRSSSISSRRCWCWRWNGYRRPRATRHWRCCSPWRSPPARACTPLAPAAAFYLMPARAFEFLIGAAVAQGVVPPVRSPRLAEAVAALGLAGLAASVALFGRDLPHPGWPTLLPCLSTAAILHVGSSRPTLVGRALGLRVPATMGLISYSLYLWHWPILVLARLAELPRTAPWLVGEAALLLVLSAATWRFVEQPFRTAGSPWRRRAPMLIPLGGAALLGSTALVLALDGLPGRFPPDVAAVAAYGRLGETRPFREGQCFLTSRTSATDYDRAACLDLAADRPNVLLLGDSHAAHLWTGLRDTWPEVRVLQATASGCKPVLGTTGTKRCTGLVGQHAERLHPGASARCSRPFGALGRVRHRPPAAHDRGGTAVCAQDRRLRADAALRSAGRHASRQERAARRCRRDRGSPAAGDAGPRCRYAGSGRSGRRVRVALSASLPDEPLPPFRQLRHTPAVRLSSPHRSGQRHPDGAGAASAAALFAVQRSTNSR